MRKRKGPYKTGKQAENEGQTPCKRLRARPPLWRPVWRAAPHGHADKLTFFSENIASRLRYHKGGLRGGWEETFFALSQASSGAVGRGAWWGLWVGGPGGDWRPRGRASS